MRVCLLCGEPVSGPVVVSMQQGSFIYRKAFTKFEVERFEDDTPIKWIHNTCAARNDIFPNLLSKDKCELCHNTFVAEESVLCVERGVLDLVKKGSRNNPLERQQGGYVHFMCAVDDWNLNMLLRLIEEAV